MIYFWIPYKHRMCHKLSLWKLSTASSNIYDVAQSENTPSSFPKPCLFSSELFDYCIWNFCMMTFPSILLVIDKRVIPRQLSQFFRETFLGIFTITSLTNRLVSSSSPIWKPCKYYNLKYTSSPWYCVFSSIISTFWAVQIYAGLLCSAMFLISSRTVGLSVRTHCKDHPIPP